MKIIPLLVAAVILSASAFGQKPTPTPVSQPFLMAVEDVFYINGRGLIATGKIERGLLKVGDAVEIVGGKATKPATVSAIEMFRKMVDEAKAGDNVGVLLRGVEKTDVERGQILAKPGSIASHTKFKAKIDLTPAAEGGRKMPIASGFRPQVIIRTASFTGTLILAAGKAQAAAGDTAVEVEIELTQPAALEKGQVVTLREFGKTIASGVVTAVTPSK